MRQEGIPNNGNVQLINLQPRGEESSSQPNLPIEILARVVGQTLLMDRSILGTFNRVSYAFRVLASMWYPQIHVNDYLAKACGLREGEISEISINKLRREAGCNSGLALQIRNQNKAKSK